MDESAATKQGRKLSTMRVDPKANDLTRPTAPDVPYTTASWTTQPYFDMQRDATSVDA